VFSDTCLCAPSVFLLWLVFIFFFSSTLNILREPHSVEHGSDALAGVDVWSCVTFAHVRGCSRQRKTAPKAAESGGREHLERDVSYNTNLSLMSNPYANTIGFGFHKLSSHLDHVCEHGTSTYKTFASSSTLRAPPIKCKLPVMKPETPSLS
jgi:hypothetical protein